VADRQEEKALKWKDEDSNELQRSNGRRNVVQVRNIANEKQ